MAIFYRRIKINSSKIIGQGDKMKKAIVLLIIVLCANVLLADTLVGEIVDAKTGKPVECVAITIDGTGLGTNSDAEGKFSFRNLDVKEIRIHIKRIGYQDQTIAIDLAQKQHLMIELVVMPYRTEGVQVSATIAKKRETPVTFTNLTQKDVIDNNSGQEIPMLMTDVPGVFAYSEAGGNIGNAHLKIRGFDQKRIGVMINGIPLNDPEDHAVYWVNMPDFAESASSIQFQRGVGSSLYGISTFGGSLNMQTTDYSNQNRSEIFAEMGSYNTYKYGVKTKQNFGKYSTNIRFSTIASDGYRDNSASELWSLFTNISHRNEKSITELNFYTGHELTHAAWEASIDSLLENNHQHNPYTYKNYVDDFSQPHLELHNNYMINEDMDIKNSLFYIRGNGFYEQYKSGRNLWEHGLVDTDEDEEADMIRQKWVTKNHFGLISSYNWRHQMGDLTAGAYLSGFNSDHWGEIKEVIGADTLGIDYESGQNYYNYTGEKQYVTAYVNELFKPINNLSIMANLYFQHINYRFEQLESGNFTGLFLNSYDVDYNFFNLRFGANYNMTEAMNLYANVSSSMREPTDSELYDTWDGPDDLGVSPLFASADTLWNEDNSVKRINWTKPFVKEEKLVDYEFGFGYSAGLLDFEINAYWMNFTDEIVAYGGADEDGNPIRGNADKTVHRGIELSSKIQLPENFSISGNFSYSDNYFEDFTMYDWNDAWEVVEVDYSGNTIAGFPSIITSGKWAYRTSEISVFTQLQYVGKQYLDNTENEDRTIDAYNVVNLGLNCNIGKLLGMESDIILNAKVNNLLDEVYETAGYYDAWEGDNCYWPAAGRNFSAGIRVGF